MSSHHASACQRLTGLVLTAMLVGCSGSDAPAPTAPQAASGAPAEVTVAAGAAAQDPATLRQAAQRALRENRMYAPAGDNAIEGFLALRAQVPQDPVAKSALTDLLPYALIAAEHHLQRGDLAEAERLLRLVRRGDPQADGLPRLQQALADAQQARTPEGTPPVRAATPEPSPQGTPSTGGAMAAAPRAPGAVPVAGSAAAIRGDDRTSAATTMGAQADDTQPGPAPRSVPASEHAGAATPAKGAVPSALHALSTPAPRYPIEALRAGTGGEVLVAFTVGTDGRVIRASVVQASPARVFEREALNAVKRWRYAPLDAPVTTRRTLVFTPQGDDKR